MLIFPPDVYHDGDIDLSQQSIMAIARYWRVKVQILRDIANRVEDRIFDCDEKHIFDETRCLADPRGDWI